MTVGDRNGIGPAAVPSADELAAILAVLASLEESAPPAQRPERSRWREAARRFETDAL